jgi:hypothetical protein
MLQGWMNNKASRIRAFSHYQMRAASYNKTRLFVEFLEANPITFTRGLYSQQLERYLDLLSRQQIKVFIYERFLRDPHPAFNETAQFLGIDGDLFAHELVGKRIGGSVTHRYPALLARAKSLGHFFRD